MEKVDEGGRQCCLGEELTFEKYNIVFTYAEGECYFCCFDCGCYGNEKRWPVSWNSVGLISSCLLSRTL